MIMPRYSLAFIVPCGRPGSPAALATVRALVAASAGQRAIVVVAGHRLSPLREAVGEDGPVRWVEGTGPLAPGGNRNLGVQAVSADILAFVDDDCLIEPGATDHIIALFSRHERLGLVTGRLTSRVRSYCTGAFDLSCFGFITGGRSRWNRPLAASLICVRQTAFDGVGGFDPVRPVREDVDLAERLLAAGWQTLYDAGLPVVHDHNRTDWAGFMRHQLRNGVHTAAFDRKHPGSGWKSRLKARLKPLHLALFPLFAVRSSVLLALANGDRPVHALIHLPGVLAGQLAFAIGYAREIAR